MAALFPAAVLTPPLDCGPCPRAQARSEGADAQDTVPDHGGWRTGVPEQVVVLVRRLFVRWGADWYNLGTQVIMSVTMAVPIRVMCTIDSQCSYM